VKLNPLISSQILFYTPKKALLAAQPLISFLPHTKSFPKQRILSQGNP
jgi:hypothetical protein